jgi:DNA polymerase II large subunit
MPLLIRKRSKYICTQCGSDFLSMEMPLSCPYCGDPCSYIVTWEVFEQDLARIETEYHVKDRVTPVSRKIQERNWKE